MPDYRGDSTSQLFNSDEFKAMIQSFGILKRFTCFLDSANFLVTGYHLLEDDIHAVFENTEGDTLQFTNLLCGYGGSGTSNTVKALTHLGISENDAVQHCRTEDCQGIQISFATTDIPGKYVTERITHNHWFETFENTELKQYICVKNVSVSIVKRTVAFIYPEESDFIGLLRCLELCEPFSFEYSLDKNSPIKAEQDLIDAGVFRRAYTVPIGMVCDANLLIRGEQFTIYCCISDAALIGTLNALYYTLTNQNLFMVHNYKGLVFLTDADAPTGAPSFVTVLLALIKYRSIKTRKRLPIERPHSSGKAVHLWKT